MQRLGGPLNEVEKHKIAELEFQLREEVMKCEEMKMENEYLRETLEMIAVNKNIDPSKLGT